MSSISGSGERILAILDLFSEAQPEWSSDEMMRALGYSRPTLYRYLKTLKDAGFLVALPGQGFTLGPRVTELDFLMQRADPLVLVGKPYLERLAARHPCSAFLARWYGRKILCVDSEVSNPAPRSSYPRGRPMPLGRGAISRVILANLPRREQDALIADLPEGLWMGAGATPEAVLAELRAVRRAGVAVAWGEVTAGVVGVAAPVLAGERAPVAALCVTSNAGDVDEARLDALRAEVKTSAEAISDVLQGRLRASA